MSKTSSSLHTQLDQSRRELLDLSRRNRLLNMPRDRRSRLLEIVSESSDETCRILVREGRRLGFQPSRADTPPERGDGEGEELFGDLAPPREAEGAVSSTTSQPSDRWLQTRLTPEGLQKRLLRLYYDARTTYEEQGVNILFLTLGTLEWYESPDSKQAFYAPLLLVPVSLARGSALERFRVSWSEEEITTNLSLLEKLRADFGIDLPEVPEVEGLVPSSYFAKARDAVATLPRFMVHNDEIALGFFSFAKFLMYRDLDPKNWPAEASLTDHELIRALLQDGFRSDSPPVFDADFIDDHIAPGDTVHVLDADSWQTEAIEAVKRGLNLVIQGPPGTGKSQTIANIIAAAILEEKRVLFVAEKRAALEVVKNRLDRIGIGDACLELHSNKANKKAVLAELEQTLNLGRPTARPLEDVGSALGAARDRLNQHCRALHAVRAPSGLTPYAVIGHVVRLGQVGVPHPGFTIPEAKGWTSEGFGQRVELVEDLTARIAEMGPPASHPWRGLGIEMLLPADLGRVSSQTRDLAERLDGLTSAIAAVFSSLGRSSGQPTLDEGDAIARTALWLADVPEGADAEALSAAAWNRDREAIAALVAAGEVLSGLRRSRELTRGCSGEMAHPDG